jgi:antitoxin component YwqK of YwqJK toxin-antitoxin module
MRLFLILFLHCSILTAISAQTFADTRPISIKDNNLSLSFSIYNDPISLDLSNALIYYSFHHERLFETQGGYTGALLHGKYEALFPDKTLHSQGDFKMGIKNGEWKYWHQNGFLKLVEHWKKGYKSGDFAEYSEQGKVIRSGRYKKGLISGKVTTYDDKGHVLQIVTYKNGNPEQAKTKTVSIQPK